MQANSNTITIHYSPLTDQCTRRGPMDSKHYDLIVIGSGPAGEKGAARVAYWGKKVALVERASVLGGMAAGAGVPAKTLRETALNISGLRHRHLYGLDLSHKGALDIATFMH